MSAAIDHASTLGRANDLDVMGAGRIGEIIHHHGEGPTESAIVFVIPPSAPS